MDDQQVVRSKQQAIGHVFNTGKSPKLPDSRKPRGNSIMVSSSTVSRPRSSFAFMAGRESADARRATKFEEMVRNMDNTSLPREPTRHDTVDFNELTNYFLGFWEAPHAAKAMGYLERLEIKRTLKALQRRYGFWTPPEDVAEALKSHPKAASTLPASKDARNLKFVLKVLGCSLHENKPYKQFLNAKTLCQKRYWLYKYQRQKRPPSSTYTEPICPTRMKRLYHFFPNNFTEEEGYVYFNNKSISYSETKKVYYIGKELQNK